MVSVLRSEGGYTLGYTYGSATELECIHEISEKWVIANPTGTQTFSKKWYKHEQIDEIYNNVIGELTI